METINLRIISDHLYKSRRFGRLRFPHTTNGFELLSSGSGSKFTWRGLRTWAPFHVGPSIRLFAFTFIYEDFTNCRIYSERFVAGNLSKCEILTVCRRFIIDFLIRLLDENLFVYLSCKSFLIRMMSAISILLTQF